MQKKICVLLAVAALLCMLFSACAPAETEPSVTPVPSPSPDATPSGSQESGVTFPYTFVDSTGRSVTLDAPPENVAVLF